MQSLWCSLAKIEYYLPTDFWSTMSLRKKADNGF